MPNLENCKVFKTDYAGRELVVEIGKYAEQANGACLVRCGETVVHVSVCMSETAREGMDFFPLSVDYEEKMFAVGKIPGGFMPDAPSNEDLTAVQLLSNMDRLRILRLLIGRKMLPREITHELNLNRGSVFRDLNNLQQAHLVEQVSQGDKLYYTANIAKANQVLDRLRTFLSK